MEEVQGFEQLMAEIEQKYLTGKSEGQQEAMSCSVAKEHRPPMELNQAPLGLTHE